MAVLCMPCAYHGYTASMATSYTYAVCYTEAVGDTTAPWTDSGIRLQLSKITTIQYGTASQSFPVRNMLSTNLAAAINRLPQVANTPITYTGDLANNMYLSIVASSLNGNNPCVEGTHAAAAADAQHSGPLQAGSSDKIVTIPQTPLLNVDTEFAICYAETDGTTSDATWRDSYVRIRITKLASIASHLVTHVTDGSIARVNNLQMTFFQHPDATRWVSLVDKTLNNNFPCDDGSIAAAVASSQHSGSSSSSRLSTQSSLTFTEESGSFASTDVIHGETVFSISSYNGTFQANEIVVGSSGATATAAPTG